VKPLRPETVIEDYAEALAVPARDGLPQVIVGGQAVNIWAERYLAREPDLANFFPFTSKDLDLIGNEFDFERIAAATGAKKLPSLRKVFVPTVGVLEISRPEPESSQIKIEVLKRIYGVTTEEIMRGAVLLERKGVKLRVIDPITLLEAKIQNAAHLPQHARQDVKHVKMMTLAVRGFLREMLAQVEAEKLNARDCVDSQERVLQVVSTRAAQQVATRHNIRWLDAFPLAELEMTRSQKLRNFSEKRLTRWRNK
jgi:hypothetical protein